MADISSLAVIDALADGDSLVVYDTSAAAGAKDKRIPISQFLWNLLGLGNVGIGTSTPATLLDVNGTANIVSTLAVGGTVRALSVRSLTSTIDDDDEWIVPAPSTAGTFFLYPNFAPQVAARRNAMAIITYNTATGESFVMWQPSTTVSVATTGILTGMTGPDGSCNVSVHTDGNIYVENRLAMEIRQGILFFG